MQWAQQSKAMRSGPKLPKTLRKHFEEWKIVFYIKMAEKTNAGHLGSYRALTECLSDVQITLKHSQKDRSQIIIESTSLEKIFKIIKK